MKVRFQLAFTLLLFVCQPGKSADLIGTIVPPYPTGWRDLGGGCLTYERTCDFALSQLQSQVATYMVVGKAAPRIDPRKARWVVTDSLQLKVPSGHHIEFADCRLNGESDGTILTVVKTTDAEWFKNVVVAYRVGLPAGRFQKISTKGIQCANVGWSS
jgi:hypothetical protein